MSILPLGIGDEGWALSLRREHLPDVLAGRGDLSHGRQIGLRDGLTIKSGELTAVWSRRPRENEVSLPIGVVAREAELRDAISWLGTYSPATGTLGALLHLATEEEWSWLARARAEPLQTSVLSGLLGLIVGEAMYIENDPWTTALDITDVTSTLSFVLGRAATLGVPTPICSSLPGIVDNARNIIGTPSSKNSLNLVYRIASVLFRVNNINNCNARDEHDAVDILNSTSVFEAIERTSLLLPNSLSQADILKRLLTSESLTAENQIILLDDLVNYLSRSTLSDDLRGLTLALAVF